MCNILASSIIIKTFKGREKAGRRRLREERSCLFAMSSLLCPSGIVANGLWYIFLVN